MKRVDMREARTLRKHAVAMRRPERFSAPVPFGPHAFVIGTFISWRSQ